MSVAPCGLHIADKWVHTNCLGWVTFGASIGGCPLK